jgi:serine/threonine protein kinase
MGQAVIAYQQNFQPHSWLTVGRVYLKNGKCKLPEPAYESEDVRKRLFAARDQSDELAPEKKKSRGFVIATPAMDTWSVGAVYYRMLYGIDPTFDSTGTLIFPSTKSIKAPQMQRLSYYLTPNPKERKNLAELDPLKEVPAQIQQSQIIRPTGSSISKQAESRIRRSKAPQKTLVSMSRPNSQL